MNKSIDWRTNIIRPGALQDCFIAEREGIHGSLEFSYAPPLGQHIEACQTEVEKENERGRGEAAFVAMCRFVSSYLRSWSEKDDVSLENIQCLRSQLLIRIYRVLCNQVGSDARPSAKPGLPPTGDELLGKS